MSANDYDPHHEQVQSDELIPSWVEEQPITWLDEIGLDRELDLAVSAAKEALIERGEHFTEERIRLAIAAWVHKSALHKLAHAGLMLTGGADHFFSILDDNQQQTNSPLQPPPTNTDAQADNNQVF